MRKGGQRSEVRGQRETRPVVMPSTEGVTRLQGPEAASLNSGQETALTTSSIRPTPLECLHAAPAESPANSSTLSNSKSESPQPETITISPEGELFSKPAAAELTHRSLSL
jgi:hypothetical protein